MILRFQPINLLSMNKSIYFIAILFSALLFGCKSDKPDDSPSPVINIGGAGKVYITCEGNYQFGNAKVSLYDKNDSTVVEDIYQQVNHTPLGDVCQSMTLFNNRYYIVLNNSSKIVVVNAASFVKEAEITGFNSPRYFVPITNSKAYVSDIYANCIYVVNLSDNTITSTIPLSHDSQQMVMMYGKVFVTSMYSDKIIVVNTTTDQVSDSITVAWAPGSVCQDKNGALWVMCSGDSLLNKSSALVQINPLSNSVIKSFTFSGNHAPWRLCMNAQNDTLYYLDRNVYRMSIYDAQLPVDAFINGSANLFYGLGVDPLLNEVYVADAVDYIQQGVVYRYNTDGALLHQFRTGNIPSGFYFQ